MENLELKAEDLKQKIHWINLTSDWSLQKKGHWTWESINRNLSKPEDQKEKRF